MRVFMVACSSRAMNQPTNQSIAQLFCGAAVLLELLRRSCRAPLIVRPQSRPSMSGRSRWDGNPRRGWWAVGWEDNSTAHVGWSHDGGWWRNVEHDRRDAVDHASWWSARAEQAAATNQLVAAEQAAVAAEQAAVADEQAAVADSNVVYRGGNVVYRGVQPPDADLIEMQKGILKDIQLPHLVNELHNVYWRVVERSRTPSELKRATELDEEITHDETMFCKVVSRLLDIGLQEAEINSFNSVTDPGYAETFREWVRSACFNHAQTAQIIQSEKRMERNEKQAEATLDAEKAEENEAGPSDNAVENEENDQTAVDNAGAPTAVAAAALGTRPIAQQAEVLMQTSRSVQITVECSFSGEQVFGPLRIQRTQSTSSLLRQLQHIAYTEHQRALLVRLTFDGLLLDSSRPAPWIHMGVESGPKVVFKMIAEPLLLTWEQLCAMPAMRKHAGRGGRGACRKQRELRAFCLENNIARVDLARSAYNWRLLLKTMPCLNTPVVIEPGIVGFSFCLISEIDLNYAAERHVFELTCANGDRWHLHFHRQGNCDRRHLPWSRDNAEPASASERRLAADGAAATELPSACASIQAHYDHKCSECGRTTRNPLWTTTHIPRRMMSDRPCCSTECLEKYCQAKAGCLQASVRDVSVEGALEVD